MNEMPIIVFGDEGGVHVVAQNILQLLHLLTFDCEISVNWDEAHFYKDEDEHEENDDWAEFVQWIKGYFGLDALTNTDQAAEIISQAQEKYKACFDQWFGMYKIESDNYLTGINIKFLIISPSQLVMGIKKKDK